MTVTEQLLEKYPEHLVEYVRQNMDLEKDDTSMDQEILEMDKDEFFARVCHWNGFINYSNTIKSWVEDVWQVILD